MTSTIDKIPFSAPDSDQEQKDSTTKINDISAKIAAIVRKAIETPTYLDDDVTDLYTNHAAHTD